MADDWRKLLTPSGSPSEEYRQQYAILSDGRFPVAPGDNERGRAALRLRGRVSSRVERKKLLDTIARRCPDLKDLVDAAREADKDSNAI